MDMTHQRAPCLHNGQLVQVGEYKVMASSIELAVEFRNRMDVLVPLGGLLPAVPGTLLKSQILWLPMADFGPPPPTPVWRSILEDGVIPLLEGGKQLAVFCHAGHGRTGTFLASLVALLEDRAETPDPIATLRDRYCEEAVETTQQAAAVFALRGQKLPPRYRMR